MHVQHWLMVRHDYKPRTHGWIVLTDMWNARLATIDCSSCDAQAVFEDLCREFQRVGWELGQRYFDNVDVRRGGVRWELRIVAPGLFEDQRQG
jgi:hypothetical protein